MANLSKINDIERLSENMIYQKEQGSQEECQMQDLVSAHLTFLQKQDMQESNWHNDMVDYIAQMTQLHFPERGYGLETPKQSTKRIHTEAKKRKNANGSYKSKAAYMAKRRSLETPEQRSQRLQSAAKYMRQKRKQEKPEERSARLQSVAVYMAEQRSIEAPEKRSRRLQSVAQYMAQRRKQETPEQRANRLKAAAEYMALKRSQETLEQRSIRLQAAAKYNEKNRKKGTENDPDEYGTSSNISPTKSTLKNYNKKYSEMASNSTDMQDATDSTQGISIKEELTTYIEEEHNIQVKIETEELPETTENTYEETAVQIKDELTVSIEQYDSQSSMDAKEYKDEETETILPTSPSSIQMKQEAVPNEILGMYPDPSYDDSMDSTDVAALSQVEACLSDEISVKTETDDYEDNQKDFPRVIKEESDLTVTETHLISNKLINTTSTFTNIHDGNIESQTTKTLIMEIHPVTQETQSLKMNPEEILPTKQACLEYDVPFQLNSITGNILSLEQEAYGLLKTKRKVVQVNQSIMCPKCPKVLVHNSSLKRHLKIHEAIENRAKGVLKGLQTRIENKKKVLQSLEEIEVKQKSLKKKRVKKKVKESVDKEEVSNRKRVRKKSDETEIKLEEPVRQTEKEGYQCTCSKVFQRRSRMETCLRSHTDFAGSSTYVCGTCDQKFNSKELLTHHRNRQHRKKYPCKFCPTDYHTQKELFKHLRVHQKVQLTEFKVITEVAKGNQDLQCLLCNETCSKLSDFKSHIMEGHEEPYNCPHCVLTFTKIVEFTNHIRKTHPDVGNESVLDVLEAFSKLVKAWKCETCGKQFHKADKLALHQVEEHAPDMKNEQHFQCGDCQRVFISKSGLNSHMRMHHRTETTEAPEPAEVGVMCLECRKICQDMNALTSHMRLHSMDRKYPCKYCDFRFATPQKRKAHAEIHTGDMKYVCFICEYQCSSENRLKHHKLSVKHLSMKEYLLTGKPSLEEQQSTSKTEKIKDTLRNKEWDVKKKKKERKEDDSETACDICGEKFTSENEMLDHKQTHPFIEFPNEDTPSRIFFK